MTHDEPMGLLDLSSRAEMMSEVDEMEFTVYDEDKNQCKRCGHGTFLHVPRRCKETCVNCGCEHGY